MPRPSREPSPSGRAEPTPPTPPGARHPASRRRRSQPQTTEETSAGGVVIDQRADPVRVAVIARLNRSGRVEWCLPKGHLEGGETSEEAAVREIREETGIQGSILSHLGVVEYWFAAEGRRIHKQVHHFLLLATGGQLSVEGDPDHEAIEAAWVPLADAVTLLAFPNERRMARAASAYLGTPL